MGQDGFTRTFRRFCGPSLILPDILVPGLDAVFVGSVVAKKSAETGHYYAHPSNRFWLRLRQSGLTPTTLSSNHDTALPAFGLGLTDLNKTEASNSDHGVTFDVPGFVRRISAAPPAWVVFNGVGVARAYAEAAGHPDSPYGFQDWTIGESFVFVVPNSSANNYDDRVLDGRSVVEWWIAAGEHVASTRATHRVELYPS